MYFLVQVHIGGNYSICSFSFIFPIHCLFDNDMAPSIHLLQTITEDMVKWPCKLKLYIYFMATTDFCSLKLYMFSYLLLDKRRKKKEVYLGVVINKFLVPYGWFLRQGYIMTEMIPLIFSHYFSGRQNKDQLVIVTLR